MKWIADGLASGHGLGVAPEGSATMKVFIADDHRITLWGMQTLIEGAGPRMRVSGSAQSCVELMEHPALPEADVLLLDLDLAGEDSADIIVEVQRCFNGSVVVLTASEDLEQHRRAVSKGARGVLHKSEPAETIRRAIEKVHAGGVWLPGELLRGAPGPTGRSAPANAHERRIASLTPREREIVGMMVQHAGSKQMAVAAELGLSEHTLRNHLTAIYQKLQVRGRVDLHL